MPSTLSADILLRLAQLNSTLNKKLGSALSPHGISFTELTVLRHLNRAPENTLRRVDLADLAGLTASGITRLLNPMEKIGLVGKQDNERDARVSLVVLTEAGKRILNEAETAFLHTAGHLLEDLTERQQRELLQLLAKI